MESVIREYYEAAYPENASLAKDYLEQLSVFSSCDYLNGQGCRMNQDIACRMVKIAALCREMEQPLANVPDTAHWAALHRHNGYTLRLAQAMEALAAGKTEDAAMLYRQMREFICQTEPDFQFWLDVYRVLEVTQKYTGFHIK